MHTLAVMDTAIYIAIGLGMVVAGLLGALLTIATLPGTWIVILLAFLAEWISPEPVYSPWTFAIVIALALAGELIEFLASGAGAAKAGGSKRAAVLGVVGGIVGAILGTIFLPFLPIIGTILGAVVGAGLGAGLGESMKTGRTSRDVWNVGRGAAHGRFIAIIVKGAIALVIGVILGVLAFV
jgi:uncharacterized protein YqgC (DUF456 family)